MTSSGELRSGRSWPRTIVLAVALGVVLAVAYELFIGDPTYTYFPDGSRALEYSAGAVVGFALVALVLTALAGWFGEPVVAGAVAVVVITVAWVRDAAAEDDSGLYVVGALLLVVGLVGVAGALAAGITFFRGRRADERQERDGRAPTAR